MKANLRSAAAIAIAGAAAYGLRSWQRSKPRPDEKERIGYPPLNTLKEVGADIWIVDSGPIKAAGLSLPVRMTVIRLTGDNLLLHSPTQITERLTAELAKLGQVRHLVAPTVGHWTFLPEWQLAFPQADVWSVPGLGDRPQVRSSTLRIDHDLSDEAPDAWAQEIEQGLVHGGGGFKEAYFFHRTTRTLILADLVQNLESAKLPPATALAARLGLADRGRTAAHVTAAALLGGERARKSIRRMVSLEPEKVVFAHGNWFDSRAAERLRAAFDWLL